MSFHVKQVGHPIPRLVKPKHPLSASLKCNDASKFVPAILWGAMMTSVVAVPFILAPVNQARGEDMKGNNGGSPQKWKQYGGFGNGGGSAYNLDGVGDRRNVLPVKGYGVNGALGKGETDGAVGGGGGSVGATTIDSFINIISGRSGEVGGGAGYNAGGGGGTGAIIDGGNFYMQDMLKFLVARGAMAVFHHWPRKKWITVDLGQVGMVLL